MQYLFAIAIVAYILFKALKSRSNNETGYKDEKNIDDNALEAERKWYSENVLNQDIPEQNEENHKDEIDYTNSYEAKYLLTKNEWYQYHKLKKLADEKGYIICPKVRLMDIIQPRKGAPKYKTLFYKIQAKHIDFLICGSDLRIKAIVELDDNSHNDTDRKERDEFVDMILQSVGYKVIHTKYISNDILDDI